MAWYEILGIVVVLLGFVATFFKNLKWKRIVEQTKVVLDEARLSLEDGKITKTEWLSILEKVLGYFNLPS